MKTVLSVREVGSNKATRRQFISDIAHLIDERIAAASGLRGALIKRAYAVMKSVRHGYVEHVLDVMADDFLHSFEPIHNDYRAALSLPSDSIAALGDYLATRQNDVYNAFIHVTDKYVEKQSRTVVTTAYRTFRPSIESHIISAIPQVAVIIERYTIVDVADAD